MLASCPGPKLLWTVLKQRKRKKNFRGVSFKWLTIFRCFGSCPYSFVVFICLFRFTLLRVTFCYVRFQSARVSVFTSGQVPLINWNPDSPPHPTPGQGGGMWGIFMVFEGTVRPWGWGISQDLLYTIPSFKDSLTKDIECIRVDGASDEGPRHEEVQLAQWWQLPFTK